MPLSRTAWLMSPTRSRFAMKPGRDGLWWSVGQRVKPSWCFVVSTT